MHDTGSLVPVRDVSRRFLLLLIFVLITLYSVSVLSQPIDQQIPERDSSAITFLTQAVAAAGGSSLASIQDFVASGAITHFWDSTEQGQLTVKCRGVGQFRLDSQLQEGTWSFISNNGAGELAPPNVPATALAYHNQLNVGSLTWPILKINSALQDQTVTIIDLGIVQFGSGQAQQIRIQQNPQPDPTGLFSKLTQQDYFFDPSSFSLLEVQDFLHPDDDANNGALLHVLDFANYQTVQGMLVPFSVTDIRAGQQNWQIQLNTIAFNTGLTDSDFQF